MGSGASSAPGAPRLPWPPGARALLHPGAELPGGLKLAEPVPCKEDGIPYWSLGGPSKARLRVIEDQGSLLELAEKFTVAVCCRAGTGDAAGYDSLILGHDNKHWLALKGGEEGTICCMEGESGKASDVKANVERKEWAQFFLRPGVDGGTDVLGVDSEGLVELGTFETSLVGSKLRNAGWATNEVHVVAIAVWDRCLSWSELSACVERRPSEDRSPPAAPEGPPPTSFRGQVVDLKGSPVSDVRVSWGKGDCITDHDGCFAGVIEEDAETAVPDDGASQGSVGSDSSWIPLSFECEGFAPMSSPANQGADNCMKVTMRPISASCTMDSSAGGSVVDSASGSSITMPPNTLSYPDGTEVTGPVTVSISVIDVTDPAGLASMPGDFSALGADGSEVTLQSLGAMWIGATDEAGNKLQVKDGAKYTLDLHTEAKANAEKLGSLPEMWSFDEESGKWLLEPSAMKVDGEDAPNAARPAVASTAAPVARAGVKKMGKKKKASKFDYEPGGGLVEGCMSPEDFMRKVAADGKKSLAAEVTKIGYINCDLAYHHPQRAVMMKGLVLDSKRQPLSSVQIWGTGRDYQGRTPDVTGEDGRFGALIAQFDSEVDVEVQYRKERQSDDQAEVFFEKHARTKIKDPALRKLVEAVPGPYSKDGELDGQPIWAKQGQKSGTPLVTILWHLKRRCWHIKVGEKVVFLMRAGDEPGSPFAEGWEAAADLAENVHAPKVTRAFDFLSKSFGPFKTGDPGEFVDVGELVTEA
eukprot:TRINITY_DN61151_c0_g1_i1.p1 TRINITY_DN61151_c0_g1~~TRINITY_DN61151_c0_g1_i1.p1  ORF type:complete len:765 (+),score=159.74 TRINITY_DN61151_c0_g1_i1:29-2296(+)